MSRRSVLVVDDEPALLRVLQATLEGEGYEVLLASDGATALQRVRDEVPDIVLLDVMLPVVDGWMVLERLRRDHGDLRVICLTAKDRHRDLLKGWRLGADEYVTKPFDVDALLGTIRDVLARTAEERSARREEALRSLGGEPRP